MVNFPDDKKVYIVGMSGIREELQAQGIRTCGADVSVLLAPYATLEMIMNDDDGVVGRQPCRVQRKDRP